MEWLNLLIIILSNAICLIWSYKKRVEINSTKVVISEDAGLTQEEVRQQEDIVFRDREDIDYVAKTCQDILTGMMGKFHKYMLIIILIATFFVWLFLEENYYSFSEPIVFFLGAYIQVINVIFLFNNYKFYDARVIYLNRGSPKHAMEFVIKVNTYITMTNQSLNLVIFCLIYMPSAWIFLGGTSKSSKLPTPYFEYFHRKFMCFGLGSIFSYFVTKSVSHLFCQGSRIVYEILHRDKGIPSDHPRNPARIINNISESFWRVAQNTMEFNALTNMGLCLFQDMFVIKYVYVYDRGFLNGLAIYSLGMVGSLISMLCFRYFSYFKFSQSRNFFTGVKALRSSGLKAMLISGVLIFLGAFLVLGITFPDSVAVYNPFRADVAMRGVKYYDTLLILGFSFLINISLVINSIFFTDPLSLPNTCVEEYTKVSLSHTILNSFLWSALGTVFPMVVFLIVIILSYWYANMFGISVNYLGCITFYQITQFFQNFKYLHNFYLTILMMAKDDTNAREMQVDQSFANISRTCTFYGKFSTGAGLFITQIMLFTILVDCVNMNIIKDLVVIDPYYIIAIIYGSISIMLLSSLDLKVVDYYVMILIDRIRELTMERLDELRYEPPVLEISQDMTRVSFIRLFAFFFLPVDSNYLDHPGHRIYILPVRRQNDQHCALRFFPVGAPDLLPEHAPG